MSLVKISNNTNVKFQGSVKIGTTPNGGGGGGEEQNALQFNGQNLQYNGETLTFTEN